MKNKSAYLVMVLIVALFTILQGWGLTVSSAAENTSEVVTNPLDLDSVLVNGRGVLKTVYLRYSGKHVAHEFADYMIYPDEYPDVTLYVDAPNLYIANEAKFKKIVIENAGSWNELADGNEIEIKDKGLEVYVDNEAHVKKFVLNKKNASFSLENNGQVDGLRVSKQANVTICQNNKLDTVAIYGKSKVSIKAYSVYDSVFSVYSEGQGTTLTLSSLSANITVNNKSKKKVKVKVNNNIGTISQYTVKAKKKTIITPNDYNKTIARIIGVGRKDKDGYYPVEIEYLDIDSLGVVKMGDEIIGVDFGWGEDVIVVDKVKRRISEETVVKQYTENLPTINGSIYAEAIIWRNNDGMYSRIERTYGPLQLTKIIANTELRKDSATGKNTNVLGTIKELFAP